MERRTKKVKHETVVWLTNLETIGIVSNALGIYIDISERYVGCSVHTGR